MYIISVHTTSEKLIIINRMIYASQRLSTYKKSSEWTAANSRKSMSFGYGSDKFQRGQVRVT